MNNNFICGAKLMDVYDFIRRNSVFASCEEVDLLKWFLENWSKVAGENVVISTGEYWYCGNHAHTDYEVSIAKIDTQWGKCVKVTTIVDDHAFYSYDSSYEKNETVFLFVKE